MSVYGVNLEISIFIASSSYQLLIISSSNCHWLLSWLSRDKDYEHVCTVYTIYMYGRPRADGGAPLRTKD